MSDNLMAQTNNKSAKTAKDLPPHILIHLVAPHLTPHDITARFILVCRNWHKRVISSPPAYLNLVASRWSLWNAEDIRPFRNPHVDGYPAPRTCHSLNVVRSMRRPSTSLLLVFGGMPKTSVISHVKREVCCYDISTRRWTRDGRDMKRRRSIGNNANDVDDDDGNNSDDDDDDDHSSDDHPNNGGGQTTVTASPPDRNVIYAVTEHSLTVIPSWCFPRHGGTNPAPQCHRVVIFGGYIEPIGRTNAARLYELEESEDGVIVFSKCFEFSPHTSGGASSLRFPPIRSAHTAVTVLPAPSPPTTPIVCSLVVFGGWERIVPRNDVWRLDIYHADMPPQNHQHGGEPESYTSRYAFRWTCLWDNNPSVPVDSLDAPCARRAHVAFTLLIDTPIADEIMFVFSGCARVGMDEVHCSTAFLHGFSIAQHLEWGRERTVMCVGDVPCPRSRARCDTIVRGTGAASSAGSYQNATKKVVILVGGWDRDVYFNDVHMGHMISQDGIMLFQWRKIETLSMPYGVVQHGLCYDDASQLLFMFGGYQSARLSPDDEACDRPGAQQDQAVAAHAAVMFDQTVVNDDDLWEDTSTEGSAEIEEEEEEEQSLTGPPAPPQYFGDSPSDHTGWVSNAIEVLPVKEILDRWGW